MNWFFLLSLSCLYVLPIQGSVLKKYLMTDEVKNGALCLDGSPAYYYYGAADNVNETNNWIIYMGWGGWCYNDINCYYRSKTLKGSSSDQFWPPTQILGGYLSDNCTVNPLFCGWNRIWLGYCDGDSFTANISQPLIINGEPIYFRGRQNLVSGFNTFKQLYNFNNAKQVLITGCSAGGLATILHADYIKTLLPPTVTTYKAVTSSGFFPLLNNIEQEPLFANQMHDVYYVHQAKSGMSPDCLKDKTPSTEWLCNTSPEALKYIKTPLFMLESDYDSWSIQCILNLDIDRNQNLTDGNCSAFPDWYDCTYDANKCTNTQMTTYAAWGVADAQLLQSNPTVARPGNGGFMYSCNYHCLSQSDQGFLQTVINNQTMQNALYKWWNSNSTTNASSLWYWPCYYSTTDIPRECNPTCIEQTPPSFASATSMW